MKQGLSEQELLERLGALPREITPDTGGAGLRFTMNRVFGREGWGFHQEGFLGFDQTSVARQVLLSPVGISVYGSFGLVAPALAWTGGTRQRVPGA